MHKLSLKTAKLAKFNIGHRLPNVSVEYHVDHTISKWRLS